MKNQKVAEQERARQDQLKEWKEQQKYKDFMGFYPKYDDYSRSDQFNFNFIWKRQQSKKRTNIAHKKKTEYEIVIDDETSKWTHIGMEHYHKFWLATREQDQEKFVYGRFQTFQKRLNKKLSVYLPNMVDLNPETSQWGLVNYFRIKNRIMLLEEQVGLDQAVRQTTMEKQDLISNLLQFGDKNRNRVKIDQKELQEIVTQIENYVYLNTPWLADIESQYEVTLAREIKGWNQTETSRYLMPLVTYLFNLSQGILNVAYSKHLFSYESKISPRILNHPEYAFCYYSAEKFNERKAVVSAVTPRRRPILDSKTGKLTSFDIDQYIQVLTFREIDQLGFTHNVDKDFKFEEKINRLAPFSIPNLYCLNQKKDKKLGEMLEWPINPERMTQEVNINSYKSISQQQWTGQPSSWQTRTFYSIKTLVSEIKAKHKLVFRWDSKSYSMNPNTGFYQFDPQLLTEKVVAELVNSEQPEWFQRRIMFQPEKEKLLIMSHYFDMYQTEESALESRSYSSSYFAVRALRKFEERQKLSKVLEILPTLQIKLNLDQQRIMNSTNDLFILGRSGTGKTTTTVLRFFCLEVLFASLRKQQRLIDYYQQNQFEEKLRQAKRNLPKLTEGDVQESTDLRMVFVTASPVLTNEVKTYYASLKDQLKKHLFSIQKSKIEDLKSDKIQELKQSQKDNQEETDSVQKEDSEKNLLSNETDSTKNAQNESDVEGKKLSEKEVEQKRVELLNFIEQKEKEMALQEQIDEQINLPDRLYELQGRHFPLFVTVQRLVYMMDASMPNSFFTRSYSGKIIGLDTSVGWHGEDGGVFTINQDFKQSENLKAQIENFELKILTGEDEDLEKDILEQDLNLVTDITQSASFVDENTQFGRQVESLSTGIGSSSAGHSMGQLDRKIYQKQMGVSWKNRNDPYSYYKSNGTNKRNDHSSQLSDKQAKSKKQKAKDIEMPLCSEITFEVFEERFIKRFDRFMTKDLSKKLSPTFVWTEIMSVIKGSIYESRTIYSTYLNLKEYLRHGSPLINHKEKKTLYYLFLKYEDWKIQVKSFDFLDVVSHILSNKYTTQNRRQYDFKNNRWLNYHSHGIGKTFDYLIVDEVQDLYPKTIKLLLDHTRYKVVFAGDTAQTIAKGVTSRISDLRTLFTKTEQPADQINLTINYRSQNCILQMANCIVKLIELLFPKSIDKLNEEVSEKVGPKPFLIDSVGEELLCQYFFGQSKMPGAKELGLQSAGSSIDQQKEQSTSATSSSETNDQEQPLKSANVRASQAPHFGASQVVIVREQRVKEQLPEFLQSMLCLTVYESKGLEFDDVILFNFFCMGELKAQHWKLLNSVTSQRSIRKHLPDWILGLDERELDSILAKIEEDFNATEDKLLLLNESIEIIDDDEIDGNQNIDNKEQQQRSVLEENKQNVENQESDDSDEEEKDQESNSEKDEKNEQQIVETKTLIELKEEATMDYYNRKREETIARFEATGEHADLIQEFTYYADRKDVDKNEVYRKFGQLCIELKFLYVGITRPKNRLFIYDDSAEVRRPLENIWSKIDAFQRVTQKDIEAKVEAEKERKAEQKAQASNDDQTSNSNKDGGSLSNAQSDQQTWRIQGLRFLKQKNYTQAMKCFAFSNDEQLLVRCKAFLAARTAQQLMNQVENETFNFQRIYKQLAKSKKKSRILELRDLKLRTSRSFQVAGSAFEKANLLRQAASCYFTGRNYSKAAQLFLNQEQWAQAGECITRCGPARAKEAAKYFEKGGMALRAIQCLEKVGEWELLLHCLNRCQEQFGEQERQNLVNKYVPIAINSMYQEFVLGKSPESQKEAQIGADNQALKVDVRNVGEKVEAKIQKKYQLPKGQDEIIEEFEDEYGDEIEFSSSDEDNSEEQGQEKSKLQQNSSIVEKDQGSDDHVELSGNESQKSQQESDLDDSNSDDDREDQGKGLVAGFNLESLINKKHFDKDSAEIDPKTAKANSADSNDSFEVIDSEEELRSANSIGQNQNNDENGDTGNSDRMNEIKKKLGMSTDSFEHLSNFDPDDQFLKSNRSMSIIESIIAKGDDARSEISEHSSFSIISSPALMSVISSSVLNFGGEKADKQIGVIQTQDEDTYMEDIVAQKLIYFLSLWSAEMRTQLGQLKSKGIMYEKAKESTVDSIDETDFIIQMDNVDQEFVDLILDTLEFYEFYHMSLLMCKRYRLSGRMGRYLVLMCSKYSNVGQNRILFHRWIRNDYRVEQQRISSMLAHEAIHNVLCLIDPVFLKMDKEFGMELTDENSLGFNAYQTIFNLGFWKKLVYILEPKLSLHLCLKFFDFTNFYLIQRAYISQDAKIANKELLDYWTLKTQFKHLALQKATVLKNVTKIQYQQKVKTFLDDSQDLIKSVQLNQKMLQVYANSQTHLGLYHGLINAVLPENETRAESMTNQTRKIAENILDSLQIIRQYKAKPNGQVFAAAMVVFDLIFSVMGKNNQARVLTSIDLDFKASEKEQLYYLIDQTLEQLGDFQEIDKPNPILEALYSNLLISNLGSEDFYSEKLSKKVDQKKPMQDFFATYRDHYHMVNINSPIFEEILNIQAFKTDHELFVIGESHFQKVQRRAFYQKTIVELMNRYFKNNDCNSSVHQWKQSAVSDRKIAFMIDMDAQFIFVPKTWIRSILINKLVRISTTLVLGMRTKGYTRRLLQSDATTIAVPSDNYFRKSAVLAQIKQIQGSLFADLIFQVKLLMNRKQSFFWSKCKVRKPKIFSVKDAIMRNLVIDDQIQLLNKVKLESNQDAIDFMFCEGLLTPKDDIQLNEKRFKMSSTVLLNGSLLFAENLKYLMTTEKLGMESDQQFEKIMLKQAFIFSQFVRVQNHLAYIELIRIALKTFKLDRLPNSQNLPPLKHNTDFEKLYRQMLPISDVYVNLRQNSWLQAHHTLLSMACITDEQKDSELSHTLQFARKTQLVEFASLILLLIGSGNIYLPDYFLKFVDVRTNLDELYADIDKLDEMSLLRRQSSFTRESDQKTKEKVRKVQSNNYVAKGQDDYSDEEYYDESTTYKSAAAEEQDEAQEDSYDDQEARYRTVILKDIPEGRFKIEKVGKEVFEGLIESLLKQILSLIEQINADDLSFTLQEESQRLFNILMAIIVNLRIQEKQTAQVLVQCFNRLCTGPFDEYFTNLGLQTKWFESKSGHNANIDYFTEEFDIFRKEPDELKWEWFLELESKNDPHEPRGIFLAQIDVSKGQSDEIQEQLEIQGRKTPIQQARILAQRIRAAHMIGRAAKIFLEKLKKKNASKKELLNEDSTQVDINKYLDGSAKMSKEQRSILMSHARTLGLKELTQIPQVDANKFIQILLRLHSKINYLQELMIVKAFQNSIEISKSLEFIMKCKQMHVKYVQLVRDFIREKGEILAQFDLVDDKDELAEISNELDRETAILESTIENWLLYVFQGDSTSYALSQILSQKEVQERRIKLKWQRLKPKSRRQQLQSLQQNIAKNLKNK